MRRLRLTSILIAQFVQPRLRWLSLDGKLINGLVAATCPCTRAIDRSSQAGYRSILVLTSLANTRADQCERGLPPAPIRTPEWSSGLSDQRRILFTPPRVTPEHKRHLVIYFERLYFSRFIYSSFRLISPSVLHDIW